MYEIIRPTPLKATDRIQSLDFQHKVGAQLARQRVEAQLGTAQKHRIDDAACFFDTRERDTRGFCACNHTVMVARRVTPDGVVEILE